MRMIITIAMMLLLPAQVRLVEYHGGYGLYSVPIAIVWECSCLFQLWNQGVFYFLKIYIIIFKLIFLIKKIRLWVFKKIRNFFYPKNRENLVEFTLQKKKNANFFPNFFCGSINTN
jgi:hypothetical protein